MEVVCVTNILPSSYSTTKKHNKIYTKQPFHTRLEQPGIGLEFFSILLDSENEWLRALFVGK